MTIAVTKATTQANESPNALVALALENKADPEVLKKLMDLQERWEGNEARKAYMEAMAAFKRKSPSVMSKDSKVDFTSAKGRTHYRYAGLGGIVQKLTSILSECGLNASWETKQEKDQVTVTCHITHALGHRESTSLSGPLDDSGNKNRIQMIGSSVTYLQRYTLMCALGLAASDKDDDGGSPREPVAMPTEKKENPPPTQPPADNAENTVIGVLEKVDSKSGEKNGKAWTRFGLTLEGGEVFGTFSDSIGADAQQLQGEKVEITWKAEGKYKTAIGIALIRE